MPDLPTRLDLFAAGRRYIRLAPSTRIAQSIVDVVGSDVNLVVGAGSVMGEAITLSLASCFSGLFVETATDDNIDRLAFDRYGLTRFPATPATVLLTFSRVSFAGGAGTISAGTRVQTAGGLQFGVDTDTAVGATALSVTANATALVAGSDSNAPAGQLVQIVDSLFDGTFTVTNAAQAAGGAERESLSAFKGRIRGYFATLRRGTLGAIVFAALDTPGVAVASAFESTNPSTGFPAAIIQLIVGDANGNSSPDVLQAVRDRLLEFRAAGIPVALSGGVVTFQPVRWLLSYATGIDSVATQADVQAVTVAVSQFLSPGETLHRSTLIAAARTVPGVIVSDYSLITPAGDIIPTDTFQVIRVRSTDVTFA